VARAGSALLGGWISRAGSGYGQPGPRQAARGDRTFCRFRPRRSLAGPRPARSAPGNLRSRNLPSRSDRTSVA